MKAIVSQEVRWTVTARQTQASAKQPPPHITKNHPSQQRQGDQRGRCSVQSHLTTLAARSEQEILLCPCLDGNVQLAPTYCASSGSTQHGWGLPVLLKKYPKNTKDTWKVHGHSSNFLRMGRKPHWGFRPPPQTNLLPQHRIPDAGDHVRKK